MARRTTSESTESHEQDQGHQGLGDAVSAPTPRRRRRATAAAAAPAQAPVAEQPGPVGASETVTGSGAGESDIESIEGSGAPAASAPSRRRRKVVAVSAAPQAAPTADPHAAEDEEDEDEAQVEEEAGAEDAEDPDAQEETDGEPAQASLNEDEAEPEAPRLPAASLLFQAPDPSRARRRRRVTAATAAPQEAPTASRHQGSSGWTDEEEPQTGVRTSAEDRDADNSDIEDEDESASSSSARAGRGGGRSRRRRRAVAGTGAPQQEGRGGSAVDESGDDVDASEADDESPADSSDGSPDDAREGGARRKRRRGGRGRRSRSRAEDSARSDSDEEAQTPGEGAADATPSARETSADAGVETTAGAVSGSRRRRRRSRTRSEGGDPRDEVTALKGSTRLEAKRQRRREGRAAGRRRPIVTEAEFLARRESVDRQMIVRESDGLNQIAVLEDGLLVEHYVSRHTQTSMVGNVYVGRVQNVLPSMEAAFVDLGKGRNAVLYAGEVNWDAAGLEGRPRRIEDALSSGDTVLVQVTKDPIGHKGARLTSQITLAGRYLVLVPGGTMTGISRKLPDTERSRLKKILKRIVPDSAGVIVRTAAEGASQEQLTADVERLVSQWEAIEKKASSVMKGSGKAPVLLKGEPELAVRVIRDVFNEDFRKLIVSGDKTWSTISRYVDEVSPDLADRLEHWTGPEDVFAAHRVDEQLAKGFDRKVWLPSGGTLVIDRTEAMTVIDVNTGRFTGAGGTLEETVTRNNLEAAEEIVRQLRLRDIGGMVVIDFVDMVLESNRDLVLRRLVECLGRDRTRHQVTEVTSLGLVQMTRKRVGQGLVEAFSTTCEHCKGRGFIVHDEPVENQQVDMSASASRGGGRSRGRKNREEQAGSGRKDAQEAKGKSTKGGGNAKSAKGAGRADVAGSPETGADDEARAAVRGALAQIAAAAEQAHKEAQQESQEPRDAQEVDGSQGPGEERAESASDIDNAEGAGGQDEQTSPAESKTARTRARKSAEKKTEKKPSRKTGKKAEKKKPAKKDGKKAADPEEPDEKAADGRAEAAAGAQTDQEPAGSKPARRTRRRATARSTAPSSENSSDDAEASA
ncbi:Rne/Rng family ribonuclease [Actinomyces viscosus]|uniref:Ribonuclease E n=1 Tax=Actinomyces viscosus TaxID=1656 RepID=A0A448PI25_ACTVI|nr:ribonuclease E/G [Actinomyces viscosus]TFH53489.1 Rne/Rng family ribonuclease [Actinomyces viscosus]VEI14560.1 Ribonuclease E [Actinomyces viscosus]